MATAKKWPQSKVPTSHFAISQSYKQMYGHGLLSIWVDVDYSVDPEPTVRQLKSQPNQFGLDDLLWMASVHVTAILNCIDQMAAMPNRPKTRVLDEQNLGVGSESFYRLRQQSSDFVVSLIDQTQCLLFEVAHI